MAVRKCPKCGATWHTDLLKCAFCGIEGEEQAPPASYPKLIGGEKPESPPEPSPAPPASPPAEPPAPPPKAEPPPAVELPPPPPRKPEPSPAETTQPGLPRVRVPAQPPAPSLPSATVPLVLALLGFAGAAVLPWAVFWASGRTAVVLGFLAGSILTPFGPAAWWAGLHYEHRCARLGFAPGAIGRTGRFLGMLATTALALEGSLLAFLHALRQLG